MSAGNQCFRQVLELEMTRPAVTVFICSKTKDLTQMSYDDQKEEWKGQQLNLFYRSRISVNDKKYG